MLPNSIKVSKCAYVGIDGFEMAKSGRRRRQRAEKSKVTLKQETAKSRKHKKKLQVKKGGFTEVKPVVQVASLNIGHRSLDEDNSNDNKEIISFRMRPLQDWLRKLSNTVTSVRLEALRALRQLIKEEDNSVVVSRFSDFFNKTLVLITDYELKIRSEAVKLVLELLAKADEPLVMAFHRQLGAYLRCSLSHIDSSVQLSGLDLLEGLIDVAPLVLRLHSETILKLNTSENQSSNRELDSNKERKRQVFSRVDQKLKEMQADSKKAEETRLKLCTIVEVSNLSSHTDLKQHLYPRLRMAIPWVTREEVNNRVKRLMIEAQS